MVMECRNQYRLDGCVAVGSDCNGKEFMVDAGDLESVSGRRWCVDTNGYVCTKINGRKVLLHRFVMGAACGEEVDHINHLRHDCRRSNLRVCARADNAKNRPIQKNNKSGYKGVGWHKKTGMWRARIRHNGKQHNLGYFVTAEEAHSKYCDAARELHREFMCTG